jgi:hypothetical protein
MDLKGNYSDLWRAVIRPPRAQYTIENLGPNEVTLGMGCRIARTDF